MISFDPNPACLYRHDYEKIIADINQALREDRFSDAHEEIRKWSLEDLFFYMHFILRVGPVNHPWLLERITEVQADNDNTMDLWSRGHYKSTIITFGLNLWDVTKDSEQRIGIFSHTRGISKSFLRRIKHTCESNPNLSAFFPEVFWKDPKSEAPKWSEDDGLILKRQGAWQEATFEAWGLVDAQPTSKHFTVLNMDDVVTVESVSTPDQILKVEDTFRVALNLCDTHSYKKRLIGTHYSYVDLYSTQEKTGAWKVRRRLCTEEGTYPGTPVLMSQAELLERRKLMGIYVFNCQMMLSPVSEENQVFQKSWLRYYRQLPNNAMNLYLFCDPASGRKEKAARSDFTVMWLWGLDPMKNLYLVDIIRDRLNLTGRWKALKGMMKKWPKIQKVYYEQYGLQADIEHFESKMQEEGIYFTIEELGGKLAKTDRIQKLVPLFESGKIYLPEVFHHPDGKRNLIKEFIEEEYLTFPFSQHDDMLDAASRLLDEKAECYYPEAFPVEDDEESEYGNLIQLSDWSQRKANSRFATV